MDVSARAGPRRRGAARDLPTGNVTLLFTDVEGSTRLLSELGERFVDALAGHNRIVREALASHGGLEVSTAGDSFFAVFERPADAVAAAAQAQRALADHDWPAGRALRVRMGIHAGVPIALEDDYAGLDVNRAARISSAAHGGQVLLSEETADAVAGSLPAGCSCRPLGSHALRDLPARERLVQLCIEGLPADFPPLRVDQAAPAAAAHRADLAPRDLLERERELARIEEKLDLAGTGRGSVLLLEGPPGIGKTQLLRVAVARAAAAGFEPLGARGAELERELRFGIVKQLFDTPVMRALRDRGSDLLSGPAALAVDVLGLGGRPQRDQAAADEFSILHGLFWVTAHLADERPMLIAVDDVHLTDRSSGRWLAYLAGRVAELPVLLVVAARTAEPGGESEVVDAIAAEPASVRLAPAPLTAPAVAELVADALGDDVDASFCEACHEATRGNPFLARELIKALAETGTTPTSDQASRVLRMTPETIARAMLKRLARLPGRADALARAVALLGARVEVRHATAVAGLEFEEAAEAADVLAAAGVLVPGRPLEFVHPIARSVVYQDMPTGERMRGHARAARILADEGAAPERVAAHLLSTDPLGDPWSVEMLRRAAAEAAPEEAVRFLRRALEEPPHAKVRGEVLLELGEAETLAFDPLEQAIEHLRLGLTQVEAPETRARAGLALSSALRDAGDSMGALEVTCRTIEELEALEPGPGSRARELLLRCEAMRLTAEDLLGRPLGPKGFARLRRLAGEGTTPGEKVLLANLAYDALVVGATADEATELALRALAGGQLLDERIYFDHHVAVWALEYADRLDEAERHASAAVEETRLRGSVGEHTFALSVRGVIHNRRGALREAEADARLAQDLSLQHGLGPTVIPMTYALLVDVLTEQGRLDAAEEAVAAAGFSPEESSSPVRAYYFHARGCLRAAAGELQQAIEDFRAAGRMMVAQSLDFPAFYPWRSSLARALAQVGDRAEAVVLAEEEVAMARRWGAARPLGVALRALGIARGGEDGIAALRESLQVLEESPAAIQRAWTLVELGAALRRSRRRSESREPLRKALDLAHRVGAAPLEERARQELAATGAKPRRAMLTGVEALTASELRVAEHAAEGLSNRQIAQTLFVSMATVDKHLGAAYRKLGVRSRRELPGALAKK